MTRKHFESIAIATAYKVSYLEIGSPERETMVDYVGQVLIPVLRRTNERFDTNRFMSACGFESIDGTWS